VCVHAQSAVRVTFTSPRGDRTQVVRNASAVVELDKALVGCDVVRVLRSRRSVRQKLSAHPLHCLYSYHEFGSANDTSLYSDSQRRW
jgi:hypothetical protein